MLFFFHPVSQTSNLVETQYGTNYWESVENEAIRREQEDAFVRSLELIWLSKIPIRNILDFGCGYGITVTNLRKLFSLNAYGVDPYGNFEESEYLTKKSLENLNETFHKIKFDAIYSIEVFEHLQDPKSILAKLFSLLNDDGMILINTATQEFLQRYDTSLNYIDPTKNGHISIYSLDSFKKLAAPHGYTANFVGDRLYMILLSKNGFENNPVKENFDLLTKGQGPWFTHMLREYMRLTLSHIDGKSPDSLIKDFSKTLSNLGEELLPD